MEAKNNSTRRHELDWLRVFGILVLLFFHTGRIFNPEGWHVKNNEVSSGFDYWMSFIHSFRMPLLLFISGAGSYFAFRSTFPFLIQRAQRLIVPLIFGIVVVLPLQFYFEHISEFSNFWDVYKSFFDFFPVYQGTLNLYHLWFLQNLFIYSLIALPILILLQSARATSFRTAFMRLFFNPVVLLLVPPVLIMLTQLVIYPLYPGRAFFLFYLSFFLLGMICYSSPEHEKTISENRRYFLAAALLILVPFYMNFPFQNTNYLMGRIPMALAFDIVVGWFWLMALISYGQYYLSRPHPLVTSLGDGIISFYILHQTVIVVIGYYICKLSWSIGAKFWTINMLTLAACATFYLLCVRPVNVMRVVFGMKLKPVPSRVP